MANEQEVGAAPGIDLVARIRAKRTQVDVWLARMRPRKRRLLNTTIIGGGISALLTAGPALGGKPFTDWLTGSLALTSPSWRLLCGMAAVASCSAALATQIIKSNSLEENLAKAQGCSAKLEILELALAAGQIDFKAGLEEFARCAESIAFLQGA
ncbi:MAG: hypothetical protein JF616_17705 [Fibrobacteres bacterium]|jgi:hypothetical protein|nr:hypothetical protein [Fibrobacterota bacterium]